MKYFVLLIALVGLLWWLRQQRKPKPQHDEHQTAEVMLPCAHCGSHVPKADAIQGEHGVYCNQAHRQAHEA